MLPPINIVLKATTDGFRQGVSVVNGQLNKLERNADGASTAVSGAGARLTMMRQRLAGVTVAAVAVAGALLVLTDRAAKNADRVGEVAASAGVAAKYYQEMGFAITEVTGVAQEDFDKALITINKRLGEAKQGSKSATEAFAQIGISQADLTAGTVTTEQAFDALVAKLGEVKDPAVAAALASDLLGKAGAKMGGGLAGGSAAVAGLVERARELGLAFSPEALKAGGEYGNKMHELQASFDGLAVTVANKLLPVLVNDFLPFMTDVFIPAVRDTIGWISDWVDWFNQLPEPVKTAADVIEKAFNPSSPIAKAVEGFSFLIGGISTAFQLLIEKAAPVFARLEAFFQGILTKAQAVQTAVSNMFGSGGVQTEMDSGLGYGGMGGAMDDGAAFGAGSGGSQSSSTFAIGQSNADGLIDGFAMRMAERQAEIAAAMGAVTTTAQDIFETHSPSEVFRRIGAFIGEGLAGGISGSQGAVTAAVKTMGDGAVAANNSMVTDITNGLATLFSESKSMGAGMAMVSGLIGAAKELQAGTFGIASAFRILAMAKGFASSIKSTGKGGTGGGASGGGGAAAAPPSPSTTFEFTFQNDPGGFGEKFGRQMAAQLNAAQRNGSRINAVIR